MPIHNLTQPKEHLGRWFWEYLERTHVDMRKTCKLQTEWPMAPWELKPETFL